MTWDLKPIKQKIDRKERKEVFDKIRGLTWSAIRLNSTGGYKGAIKVYRNYKNREVAVMFYINTCFIIRDKQGVYSARDLKNTFYREHMKLDLDAIEHIANLQVVVGRDEYGNIYKNDSLLMELGLAQDMTTVLDICNRLEVLKELGESEEVELRFK